LRNLLNSLLIVSFTVSLELHAIAPSALNCPFV